MSKVAELSYDLDYGILFWSWILSTFHRNIHVLWILSAFCGNIHALWILSEFCGYTSYFSGCGYYPNFAEITTF